MLKMEKMEKMKKISPSPTTISPSISILYVDWEEVLISNEKGRREVHYYLKKKDGSSRDLAVIGKERSPRHMSYSIALSPTDYCSISSSSPLIKLRSRREVLDWLSSIVSDAPAHASTGFSASDGDLYSNYTSLKMRGHHSKKFSWVGSPWTCRKRRQHYHSFCRNGITVSVHDFVYVLAEENKRLVAYLEDLYEDSRGNKMVIVQWFHKIDEVGIVLPSDFNDREIFFSLCLQDLSVECIDGLATVLSPEHFEKFKLTKYTLWEPFMCQKQFDNDDITDFDITQVKGYWKQEVIRYIHHTSSDVSHLKVNLPCHSSEGRDRFDDDCIKTRPRKKHCRSKSMDVGPQISDKKNVEELFETDLQPCSVDVVVSCSGAETSCLKEDNSTHCFSTKDIAKQMPSSHLAVGCHIEVLSQDSGIRGCWFRGVVLKRHKDKVKVQYQDLKDALDETKNLEEWVPAMRIAMPDKLGVRLCGRTTVRPDPSKTLLGLVEVGSLVDAWWNDGWWEGIVVSQEPDERFHVYLTGEGRFSTFSSRDLRRSQDWICNAWSNVKERPDLVGSILSDLEKTRKNGAKSCNGDANSGDMVISPKRHLNEQKEYVHTEPKDGKASCSPNSEPSSNEKGKTMHMKLNFSKCNLLSELKWNTPSKKRSRLDRSGRRQGGSGSKLQSYSSISSHENTEFRMDCENYLMPNSVKVDIEKCKYEGDSVTKSSVVCPLTSLVMSM